MSINTYSYFSALTNDQLIERVDKKWPDVAVLCQRVQDLELKNEKLQRNVETLVSANNSLLRQISGSETYGKFEAGK